MIVKATTGYDSTMQSHKTLVAILFQYVIVNL